MRCDQCKFWSRVPLEGREPGNIKDYGQCERTRSQDGDPVVEESLAVAYDTESYHAILETEPHFGCVMFEAKPHKSS